MNKQNRKPSLKKDGPVIKSYLTESLKEFSSLMSIGIAYSDPSNGLPQTLSVVVGYDVPLSEILDGNTKYNVFHKKLHEEVGKIMPTYTPRWYVNEVISIAFPEGKKMTAALIETHFFPEKDIHDVKVHNFLEEKA